LGHTAEENRLVVKKVLVIGDVCTDVYQYGSAVRICPEAPVPVFVPSYKLETSGMAANVFNNLSVIPGIDPTLIGNIDYIEKLRYVDSSTMQIVLRVDSGEPVKSRFSVKDANIEDYQAVIISDYDKGFLSYYDIRDIASRNPIVFLDTKKLIKEEFFTDVKFIKINRSEYESSQTFLGSWSEGKIILTDGGSGAHYKGNQFSVPTVSVKDMTGAGDTFIAGLCSNYLTTWNIESAIKFANRCSTQVVQRNGVSVLDFSSLSLDPLEVF